MAEEENSGIEIHTIETDMEMLGIEAEESIEKESTDGETSQKEEGNQGQEATEPKKDAEPEQKADAPKRKTRAQRRIEKLARENQKLKEQLEAEKKREETASKKHKEPPEELNIDDFDSYDDYLEALEKQEAVEETAPTKQTIAEREANEEPAIDVEELKAVEAEGKDKYEDYDKVVYNENLPLTEDTLAAVLNLDDASDILYYIGKNLDTAKELAGMEKEEMLIEIGKIEAKVSGQSKKSVKTSEAPEPITPVSGVTTKKHSLDDNDLSFEEHEALLNEHLTKHKRGGFI